MDQIEKIKKIIKAEFRKEGINVLRIILFGSRARGDFNDESDWDFLIVVDEDINRERKWDIILRIKRKLAKLKIPNDMIINSENQFQERKDNVGYITHYAFNEGQNI